MKNDNRGFTLVELIISIALLGIIAVAAAGFLVTGTRTYTNVNYSVRLQYETQLAMNQIQSYVMNCSKGAAWDSSKNTLYLISDRTCVFQFSDEKILFGSGANAQEPPEAEDILAEHVTGFTVSFVPTATGDEAITAESAKITLTMERGGKAYTGTQTIALRNKPLVANSWSDLWTGLNP
jgi:prepilin-type N-terminal cleavage/methylation domain-containing protein